MAVSLIMAGWVLIIEQVTFSRIQAHKQQITQLPLPFNISSTQHLGDFQIDGSFWINSFIHGSNGHNYYIASHVQSYASDIPGALPSFRAAILDMTDPSFYRQFLHIAPANTTFWGEGGEFHAAMPGFGMESISSDDPLKGIRTYSSLGDIEFDLTFNFTSPVLLNAALGSYLVGGEIGYEWSLPKGATQGWLKVNGECIDIIPGKSLSWYDRQWGSLQDSFQWIMIQLEESDWLDISVLVVWEWKDIVNGGKEFATIRSSATGRDSVVPLTVTESSTNVWVSKKTGLIYPQEWVVVLDDIEILVKSPRPDQIFEADRGTGFPSQFSGYVDVVASKPGHAPVKGFGAVDLMSI